MAKPFASKEVMVTTDEHDAHTRCVVQPAVVTVVADDTAFENDGAFSTGVRAGADDDGALCCALIGAADASGVTSAIAVVVFAFFGVARFAGVAAA